MVLAYWNNRMEKMMKRKKYVSLIFLVICLLLAGCSGNEASAVTEDVPKTSQEEEKADKTAESGEKNESPSKKKKKKEAGKASGQKSLAQRMAGKYSYHYSDEDGNDEFLIMDVVPFGDNLYAFCGRAMTDDYKSLEAYTFWAAEFIPYDSNETASTDGETVSVNELRFSVMSNAGMYWDAGIKGNITLTDDGLVFEGFENDDFLVPEGDDSRLFLKDDRVEDAFGYLKHDQQGGDEDLQGLWILDNKGADLYLEFKGSDLYMYRKDPNSEVLYLAGGCDFSKGSFECVASRLGYGAQPMELSGDYEVSGDTLTLKMNNDTDLPEEIPVKARFSRIKDGNAHVTTMDEVELDMGSLGMFGQNSDIGELTSQDYYGVFVSSAKAADKLEAVAEKLESAGFAGSGIVFTPDFSGLNPEPYYVATTGMYTSESDAQKALSEAKAAGYSDAYVKYAGTYTGNRYLYTMHGSESIEVLKDGVILRKVSVMIPYPTEGDEVTADLVVSRDAVFDKTADTGSFGNYESGDSPYEWIVRNYELMNEDTDRYLMNGPALSGVFEVGIEDDMITTYYGSYWWD